MQAHREALASCKPSGFDEHEFPVRSQVHSAQFAILSEDSIGSGTICPSARMVGSRTLTNANRDGSPRPLLATMVSASEIVGWTVVSRWE